MTHAMWLSKGRLEACLYLGDEGMGIERSDGTVSVAIWVVKDEETGRELELVWGEEIDYYAEGMKVRLKKIETMGMQGYRKVKGMLQRKLVEAEGEGKRVYGERDKGDDLIAVIWKDKEIEVHRCGQVGIDEGADWLWRNVYRYDRMVFEVIG